MLGQTAAAPGGSSYEKTTLEQFSLGKLSLPFKPSLRVLLLPLRSPSTSRSAYLTSAPATETPPHDPSWAVERPVPFPRPRSVRYWLHRRTRRPAPFAMQRKGNACPSKHGPSFQRSETSMPSYAATRTQGPESTKCIRRCAFTSWLVGSQCQRLRRPPLAGPSG